MLLVAVIGDPQLPPSDSLARLSNRSELTPFDVEPELNRLRTEPAGTELLTPLAVSSRLVAADCDVSTSSTLLTLDEFETSYCDVKRSTSLSTLAGSCRSWILTTLLSRAACASMLP